MHKVKDRTRQQLEKKSKDEKDTVEKPKKIKKKNNASSVPQWLIWVAGVFGSIVCAVILTEIIVVSRMNAVSFDLGEEVPLEGVLAVNNRLTEAEILLDDQVYGPESIAVHEQSGKVYTGLKTGLICEIDVMFRKPKIVKAVRLTSAEDCDGSYQSMEKCGRPLGIRLNEFGELLVVDAYLGLHVINWEKEATMKVLGTGELPVNDENAPPVRYLNDLDLLPDGRIILTESSTKFDDRDFMYDVCEHQPNGRILVYDPRKKNLFVLKDGLYFPNGIQVSLEKGVTKDDPIRVFYSEMGMARIMTIWVPADLFSKKEVKVKPFIAKLPGYPDNIRMSQSGHLLVPIAARRTNDDRYFEKSPRLRETISKLLSPKLFNAFGKFFTNYYGLVLKVDIETGKIIKSYQDATGKVHSISIAVDDGDGNLLLGSDDNYYIGRVKQ